MPPPGKIRCRSLNDSLCHPALDSADLSRNLALTKFQLRVDRPNDLNLVPSPLRETLSTISSPAFSEFVLRLEGCPMEIGFFRFFSAERTWGDEWGVVDRDLNDMVQANGKDIRLVVQVGAVGGVWTPKLGELVGGVFPLMNARGVVSVEVAKPKPRAKVVRRIL